MLQALYFERRRILCAQLLLLLQSCRHALRVSGALVVCLCFCCVLVGCCLSLRPRSSAWSLLLGGCCWVCCGVVVLVACRLWLVLCFVLGGLLGCLLCLAAGRAFVVVGVVGWVFVSRWVLVVACWLFFVAAAAVVAAIAAAAPAGPATSNNN